MHIKKFYLVFCFWMIALSSNAVGITVNAANNVLDTTKTKQIKIIPSTFKDKAAVSFVSLQNETSKILVSYENDQTVQQYEVQVKKGNNLLPVIDLNQLHPGSYKVTLISANGIQRQTSFIIF